MRALLSLLLLSGPTAAIAEPPTGGIKILESNGTGIAPGTTRLVFGGEAGTRVHQIVASGAAVSSFGGVVGSGYAETTTFLCTAPCTVEVPNGLYELRASDNMIFGGRFSVVANGQPQSWEVEESNAGLGVLGILGTGLGLGGVIGGAMLLAFDSDDVDLGGTGTGLAVTAGSAGLATLGIWALVNAFADAEQVEP